MADRKAGKKAAHAARTAGPRGAAAARGAGAPAAANGSAALWRDTPERHDYPAAAAYLSLLADEATVQATVAALQEATVTLHAAKDLLRASRLPLLGTDNAHVRGDLRKIGHGTKLSPVLLVRGDADQGRDLLIADGYHRVCASYHTDENTPVPAKLVPLARPHLT